MNTLPSWAIFDHRGVGAAKPGARILMALIVAGLLGLLKDAGIAAYLATVVGGAAAYFLARRVRAAPND